MNNICVVSDLALSILIYSGFKCLYCLNIEKLLYLQIIAFACLIMTQMLVSLAVVVVIVVIVASVGVVVVVV